MKDPRSQTKGGGVGSKSGLSVCACPAHACVFARTLHVLAKPWGGIIANFSPRTQSLSLSLSPSMDLHPSFASAEGHVVMR